MRLAIVAIIAIVAGASTARAQPNCQELVDRARAHHEAERYREALSDSEAAYACKPEPSLLFAMGQIAFNLEDYAAAEGYYNRFLATNPAQDDAAIALQALAVTRERIEAAKKPEKIVVVPGPVREEPPADKLAWGFAIGGGVALLAGGALYLVARQQAGDTSGKYSDYDDRVATAKTLRIAAIAAGGIGAALGVVAAVRWLSAADTETPTKKSAVVPLVGGDVIGVGWVGDL
jgi:tetratricopeptide (TPR) repeat protein